MNVYRTNTPRQKRSSIIPTQTDHILMGAKKASEIRRTLKIPLTSSVNPADIAVKLGVEVRYVDDITSMEGCYRKSPKPTIIVSALRPFGRQAFTIGHELGHHVFGHPVHVLAAHEEEDENNDEPHRHYDASELQADAFAAHLLMPKIAVMHAFTIRGIQSCENATPEFVYSIACWFGVGYSTLVSHMHKALRLIGQEQATYLRKYTPKKIKPLMIGRSIAEDVIPVDLHWASPRTVDTQVGDLIVVPASVIATSDGLVTECCSDLHQSLLKVKSPGIVQLIDTNSDWALHLRASRRHYAGLARYRYLEETEED